METTDFNSTANQNSTSLKTKLNDIETVLRELNEKLLSNRKNSQMLKGEKETLKSLLSLKSNDLKDKLTDDLKELENKMRQHFAHQKTENERIQQQIASLKNDRNALRTQLIALQRRMSVLEKAIGNEQD